ncbi:Flp family type IVb pilin [Allosphingosinicella indica]|uniref:Pilus assembly protein Flp/PilA n=1 Tax=Allosphingosinicella indica TaxID=941907 RepID=A0A1X7GQU5_9SPHN|nr:Flp family type IVb pilin [Allosphingosinicella indica]SMF73327.1 pilus assembly protein Flp/PilA [Allosphingosinicella indica]
MKRRLIDLIRDEEAATAIEYGLIAALVVVAMIAALQNVADVTTGMWNNVSNKVSASSGGT